MHGRKPFAADVFSPAHAVAQRQSVHNAHSAYTWELVNPPDNLLEERERLVRLGISHIIQRQPKGEQALRLKAEVLVLQMREALDQQAGSGKQGGRQRHLGNDETVAKAAGATTLSRTAAALVQGLPWIGARCLERRRDAEQKHRS